MDRTEQLWKKRGRGVTTRLYTKQGAEGTVTLRSTTQYVVEGKEVPETEDKSITLSRQDLRELLTITGGGVFVENKQSKNIHILIDYYEEQSIHWIKQDNLANAGLLKKIAKGLKDSLIILEERGEDK